MIVERLCLGHLHHLAHIHHRHTAGDVFDHAEVVRYKEVGQPQLVLKIFEQVEGLRLHRHIQCRYRFVADDKLRVQRQRTRDADPLALTAAKRMGIPADILGAKPDGPEKLCHPLLQFSAVHPSVDHQRFPHKLEQCHTRIQGRVGVLEDNLHLLPDSGQSRLVQLSYIDDLSSDLIFEQDLAICRFDGP